MSQCRVCGRETTGAFCPFCGTPVGDPAPWTPPDAAAPTQVARPVPSDPYAVYYRPSAPAPAYPPAYPPAHPPTPPAYVEPAPGGSGGPPVLPVIAGILALAVVGVGFLVVPRLLTPGTPPAATPGVRSSVQPPATVTQSTPTRSTTPPTPTPTPTPTPGVGTGAAAEATALTGLQTTVSGQQGQLNTAVDAHVWVAQLSSKYVGINDPLQTTASGSHTFNAVDILDEYRRLAGGIPDATVILADSRTFGKRVSYNGQPYWRTLALSPTFTSAGAVNAWCAHTFPDLSGDPLKNQCLPMQL